MSLTGSRTLCQAARPPMCALSTRRIHRLSPDTASRIAAGEVIDRPLSALKEVLENALDASARAIEVRVEKSLDQRFTVADDGIGIAPDELELAFERHATSKIATLEDLDRLVSLGFRGEALPSIAAVSRLRITSRPASEDAAASLVLEAGEVKERAATTRATGTTVEVSDLFFNTPARRKFLNSPTGELRAALRLLETYGLAFPEVSFRLVVDGRQRFAWPAASSTRERAAALWGAHHAEQRIEVVSSRDGLVIEGLLGLPEHARATREGQQFLVNRRWIQSALLGQALRKAYGNLLPEGRYPVAVLWLTVPTARLDVNVHPTKREVRFADDGTVFALVAGACAQKLAHLQPPFTVVYGGSSEPRWASRVAEPSPDQTQFGFEPPPPQAPAAPAEGALAGTPSAPPPVAEPELWQLHHQYILAPVRGGLVVIDQHAAHERILYEDARRRLENAPSPSQRLMFPKLIDLAPDRFDLLLEIGPWLQQLGWDLAPYGAPTVVIQGIPA